MVKEEKLKNLPTKPGVYLFKNKENKVLYIGKAKQLRNRIRSYFQKSRPFDPRLSILISKTVDLDIFVTDTDVEALILEANLIKKHKPRYNINLKDDKSYPYIRITAEDFPQVFATRKIIRDGSDYFGPYTNVKEIRSALTTLKRLFSIRSCKFDLNQDVIAKKKVQLCLDYFIKRCKGPCQGFQSKDAYALIIEKVRQFLRGKTNNILSELHEEMQKFAKEQQYEDAALIRDKIAVLEKYRHSQKVIVKGSFDRDIFAIAQEDDDACTVIIKIREGKVIGKVHYYLNSVLNKKSSEVLEHFVNQYYSLTDEIPMEIFLPEKLENQLTIVEWLSSRLNKKVKLLIPQQGEKKKLMQMCVKNASYLLEELKLQKLKVKDYLPHVVKSLQRDLKLKIPPRRIECFDISNLQGKDPVASMVCFIDGKPKKNDYRRFKINIKETPDDFAMIREAVKRRYSRLLREKKILPDLIMIDGGKGQLSSAVTVLNELQLHNIPIIGLAKRMEEIFIPGYHDAQMLPRTSSSLRILQQVRDEAHRFAITFHRQRRKKRTLTSSLDQIPGIGPKRRNHLLKTFGSVKKIRSSNVAEISSKAKIPTKLAQQIYNFLQAEKGRL